MAKVMTFRVRCSSYIICQRWNIDADERCVSIPRIIQNDGHTNWDRAHYHFGYYRNY